MMMDFVAGIKDLKDKILSNKQKHIVQISEEDLRKFLDQQHILQEYAKIFKMLNTSYTLLISNIKNKYSIAQDVEIEIENQTGKVFVIENKDGIDGRSNA